MSRINRRSLLTAVGLSSSVIVSGCLSDSEDDSIDDGGGNDEDDDDNPPGADVETVGTTIVNESCDGPGEGVERTVCLKEYDTLPDAIPLSISMEMTEKRITADTAAHIRKEIVNTHDEPITFERIFYKGSSFVEETGSISVYSLDAFDTPTTGEAIHCIPGADPDEGREWSDMTDEGPPPHYDVALGGARVVEYIVADDWESEGCFPPGEYRFENETRFPLADNVDETVDLEWGFSIEVVE